MINEAEMTKLENNPLHIIHNFDRIRETLTSNGAPQWLKQYRQEAYERLCQTGFPTVHDEEWKYTNITPVTSKSFKIAQTHTIIEADEFDQYHDSNEINIVFVNGAYAKNYSHVNELPKGITVLPLNEAVCDKVCEPVIKKIYDQQTTNRESAFIALNRAFTHEGVFINIAPNCVSKDLLHIIHITSTKENDVIIQPRSVIFAGQSSQAAILESHIGFDNKIRYLSNALSDIYVSENATLHYSKAQRESLNAFHLGYTRVWQERNSNFNSFSYMSGGKITRNNLDIMLNGEGSNTILN